MAKWRNGDDQGELLAMTTDTRLSNADAVNLLAVLGIVLLEPEPSLVDIDQVSAQYPGAAIRAAPHP